MDKTRMQRVFYRICVVIARIIVPLFFPQKVHGREHLPQEPFVFCANHVSLLDCIFMAHTALPRETYFIAKAEVFKNPLFSWCIRALGAFPVNRGSADMAAIKKSIAVVKSGHILGIYPEGTRNRNWQGHMQPFTKGAGFIALMTQAPVVPMFFADVYGFRLFRRANLYIGPPVDLAQRTKDLPKNERTAQATQEIYANIEKIAHSVLGKPEKP